MLVLRTEETLLDELNSYASVIDLQGAQTLPKLSQNPAWALPKLFPLWLNPPKPWTPQPLWSSECFAPVIDLSLTRTH